MMKKYLSLVKFGHTVFALPFALIGFFLGIFTSPAGFSWELLVKVLLCMVFARNTAMAFNRYADRRIDTRNVRTASRELPSGTLSPNPVLTFVIINGLLFMAVTFFINLTCFLLSPVALVIIVGYSYTKRFTSLSHLVLGMGLSLAPIGAYLAVTESFELIPLLISICVLFWVSGFDIIYAIQDIEFDRANNLFSIPALLGTRNSLKVSSLAHVLSALCLLAAGIYGSFGVWYWIGTVFFIMLLIYQHLIIKPDDLSRINVAFFKTNGFASIIFAAFTIIDLMLR